MRKLTRRDLLQAAALSSVGYLAGCAVNPVSGQSQLMLLSEGQEVDIDRQKSPYQFSEDYGVVQDQRLNSYLNETGRRIAAQTHRPRMPYSFRAVNAVYVNAYAFPGGSIALTRGILLKLDNEAQLAALLGHELGHVSARHTAQQMSKGTLIQALSGGVAAVAGGAYTGLGEVASQLGSLGAGALLASYSRDNEREADALGLEYMVRAGYGPEGILGLMDMLNRESKRDPSALELMFSTHPMSRERYDAAKRAIDTRYRQALNLPQFRERYLDNTAKLRGQKVGIEAIERGVSALAKKDLKGAEGHLNEALRLLPDDYAALVVMAKIQLVAKKDSQAVVFAERAKRGYPQEAQGYYVSGLGNLRQKHFDGAYNDFSQHQRLLAGNPNTTFYLGLSAEGMGRRDEAVRHYSSYLQTVKQGEQAQYAYQRLTEWGYVKK
ncbi:MAG: M48 family metalloprotease [Desulfobulbaceae bacterium]|nr:M48 family metalloprotease [Desulfobulbaceae bacterium]MDP2105052.1 M48 family metalloprotease [Desulfobulbaceae bacterium]